MAKFKQETLEIIKSDPLLFAKVCNAMEVKPTSLPNIIERNGNNINQYSIVKMVADYLGKNPEELIEEELIPARN